MTIIPTSPSPFDPSHFSDADIEELALYSRISKWLGPNVPLALYPARMAVGVVLGEHGNNGAALREAWRADSASMLDRAAKVPGEFLAFIRKNLARHPPPDYASAIALANNNEELALHIAKPDFRAVLRREFESFVVFSEEEDGKQ